MKAVSEASADFPYHLPLTDCSLEEDPTLQQRAAEQRRNQPSLLQLQRDRAAGREGTGDVQKLPMPLIIVFAKVCLDLFIPALASFLRSPRSIPIHPVKKQPVVLLQLCTGLRWESKDCHWWGAKDHLAHEA